MSWEHKLLEKEVGFLRVVFASKNMMGHRVVVATCMSSAVSVSRSLNL